jgi:hypothetical protein
MPPPPPPHWMGRTTKDPSDEFRITPLYHIVSKICPENGKNKNTLLGDLTNIFDGFLWYCS